MSAEERRGWTREELLVAINLYCRIPFGRIHVRNLEIIQLAEKLGRTPGSLSYKLANFASLDPSLYEVLVSSQVTHDLFRHYAGRRLTLPQRFKPDPAFLEFHRNEVFVR